MLVCHNDFICVIGDQFLPLSLCKCIFSLIQIINSPFSDRKKSIAMSGCLDNCRMPECEWLNLAERRNAIATIISGGMVSKSVLKNLSHDIKLYDTNKLNNRSF